MTVRKNLRKNLTQSQLKEILRYDENTGKFTVIKVYSKRMKIDSSAGTISKTGHIAITIGYVRYLAHRLAWLYMIGEWPKYDIDHINGISGDNKWSNLRLAKPSDNLCNRGAQRNNTSGYKNVSWCKLMNKWVVRIAKNRIDKVIGYFDNIEEANIAAIAFRKKIHGNFCIENRLTS